MCCGSVHVERGHLIADLNSLRVGVNSSQVIAHFEEVTAIYQKFIKLVNAQQNTLFSTYSPLSFNH